MSIRQDSPEEFLRLWRGKVSGRRTNPSGGRPRRETLVVIAEHRQEIRAELAEMLQDELGQQLAGAMLSAGALWTRLARRDAAEEREAAYLLETLKNANRELDALIAHLDEGKRR